MQFATSQPNREETIIKNFTMKKNLLLSLVLGATMLPAAANLNGDGYYRVENYKTERWVEVVDNYGTIDWVATSADLHAVELQKDFSQVVGKASSVLYISHLTGNFYNIYAQGLSISDIINHNVALRQSGSANGQELYRAYGTYNNVTRYLGDLESLLSPDMGVMGTGAQGDYVSWYIYPVSAESTNFFGAEANISAGGKYYTTLYASFPFSPASSSTKTYVIGRIDHEMAEMIEVTGVVPGGTPVIVEGASAGASNNRMNLGGTGSAPASNALKGVYFDYGKNARNNYVKYDANTMRVLGTCKDGSLGFITANISTIPANSAYITVPANSPAEFKCVTTKEFDAYEPPAPPAPEYPEALYVIGNFNSWTVPQNAATYFKLSKTGDATYSGQINWDGTGNLEFKVFDRITDSWDYAYGSPEYDPATLVENVAYTWSMKLGDGASNFVVTNWGGSSGTISVNLESNKLQIVTAKIKEEEPVPDDPQDPEYPETLWLAGNFTTNVWDTTDMTYTLTNEGEGLYSGEFEIAEQSDNLQFKVVGATDWSINYGGPGSGDYVFALYMDKPAQTSIYKDGANWCISNWEGGIISIKLNLEDNTIEIIGPDQPEYGEGPGPDVPTIDYIYLIGDMNGWNFNSSDYVLEKADYADGEEVSENQDIYQGVFEIEPGTYYFRFYTALGNAEQNSLGSSENADDNVPVVFGTDDAFTSPYFEGKGCWVLEDWTGGEITFNVNMTSGNITLSSPGAGNSGVKVVYGLSTDGVYRVYDLSGNKVMEGTELNTLPAGLYIINGQKVMVR